MRLGNPDATGATVNQANVTENPGQSNEFVHGFIYDAAQNQWTLTQGGLRQDVKTEATAGDITTVTHDVRDGAGQLVRRTVTKLKKFPFGRKPIEEVVDPAEANLKTTYEYHVTGINGSLLKKQVNPDGSWVAYEYDPKGRTTREERTAAGATTRVTETTYATTNPVRTEVEKLNATVVARRWTVVNGAEVRNIRAVDPAVTSWSDASNLVSRSEKYGTGAFATFAKKSQGENGVLTTYAYVRTGGTPTRSRTILWSRG